METFIKFLESKCIDETGCKKDNFEEHWGIFIESVTTDDDALNAYANEWKRKELEKWVEMTDKAIKELQAIRKLIE